MTNPNDEKIRTVQELIGTVFMFPEQVADFWNPSRVEFYRMNSPLYSGEKWCARRGAYCLNRDAKWEVEPTPSGRKSDFYARCRFDTLEEAVAVYNRSADTGESESFSVPTNTNNNNKEAQ